MPGPTLAIARSTIPRGTPQERAAAVVRFAGDLSDGVLLVGTQFTHACAMLGNAVMTIPDPAAEIRAPAGALAGVTAFQCHFAGHAIHTPGDRLDLLVALNPSALRTHIGDLSPAGLLIVDADRFVPDEWAKAGYIADPLQDAALQAFRVLAVPISQLNRDAVARVNLISTEVERCKSFFVLGLSYWLFDRPPEPTFRWIRETYSKNPGLVEAHTRAFKAGWHHAETLGPEFQSRVSQRFLKSGKHRMINGATALALGFLAAARQSGLPMVYAGFPVAPASELLHLFTEWKQENIQVIQAEDDLAAANIALGAAFGGSLGVTATTGTGAALQADTLALAAMSELPMVAVHVQRAGPSLGMPTRTEQADLLQAFYGRNGECPVVVLAQSSPVDGFRIAIEAVRLAVTRMTPVVVLADTYLMSASEAWHVPSSSELPMVLAKQTKADPEHPLLPYSRDEHLARPWAIPGRAGLEHRTGGMEKEANTGAVSYDPANHEAMVALRARKIAKIAEKLPPLVVHGPKSGDVLIVAWGSVCGAAHDAAERCRAAGLSVANVRLTHLSPLPADLIGVLRKYRRVLVPELNAGQLSKILRAEYLIDIASLNKVQGKPFLVSEIEAKVRDLLQAPG